jgi:hypothetical protein
MPLREALEKQGNWLFKLRGCFPLIFLPVIFIALWQAGLLQQAEGDLIDDIREAFCVMVSFAGLSIRAAGKYRHTLYLGNFIILLGGILFIPVLWFDLSAVFVLCLYYISALLADRHKSPVQLSFKEVLKSEYSTLFAIIAAFTIIDVAEDFFARGRLKLDPGWVTFFAVGLMIYAVLRVLDKAGIFKEA